MSDGPKIVTGLGKAELHRILVRGHDLTEELVGKITFTDMTFLMLMERLPTADEARKTGVYGRYCELLQAIARAAETRGGRRLPVNVTGAIAACASDLGLPWQMAKAFALIGRTLGAMAHIGEEIRNPSARAIDAAI